MKPNNTDTPASMTVPPRGPIVITNVPLLNVVVNAYGVPSFRVLGAPDWVRRERFDIAVTRKNDDASNEPRVALQGVLAERFKLRAHRETREQPVYKLVATRRDGTLGPRLKPSSVDCTNPSPPPVAPSLDSPCAGLFGVGNGGGAIVSKGLPLTRVISALSMAVNRAVVDDTGLAGFFDVDLRWSSDVNTTVANSDTPSIFTALQEQLGLRLEPATAPVEVLVIDSVERPTPN